MEKGAKWDLTLQSRINLSAHLSRLLLKVDLPPVRVEAVAERVERQDQVETRTDKCLKWRKGGSYM